MTIWLIAERTKYDNGEMDYDTPEERYGYFLTEEDAVRRIALIYEDHRNKHTAYVRDKLQSNEADIRAYETATIKADILRANGFPDEPYPRSIPSCSKPSSFEEWLREHYLSNTEYVPYPLELGEI